MLLNVHTSVNIHLKNINSNIALNYFSLLHGNVIF